MNEQYCHGFAVFLTGTVIDRDRELQCGIALADCRDLPCIPVKTEHTIVVKRIACFVVIVSARLSRDNSYSTLLCAGNIRDQLLFMSDEQSKVVHSLLVCIPEFNAELIEGLILVSDRDLQKRVDKFYAVKFRMDPQS